MKRLLLFTLLFIITLTLFSCIKENGSREPEITDVQPTSGPPGTAVTISGRDFSPKPEENKVSFGSSDASVSEAAESTLKTLVPEGAETGPVKVTIGDNTANGPQFTVEAKAPGITTIEPDSGTVGAEITITGENFSTTPTENTITFNGTQATVKSAAADHLVTEVPQGATDGPVKVTVEQKSATSAAFDVITDGTLEVHTNTTGSDKDSDGYEVSVDGNSPSAIENTGMITFSDLEEGSYQLELSGLANNCSVSDDNPRTVAITAGDTTSTTFEISCQAPTTGRIVFNSDRDGDSNIYSMKPDGSDLQKLTNTTGVDAFPVVSNDGSKIAFSSTRGSGGLFIMDADGSNVEQVISSGSAAQGLSWSPDDTKLVYTGTVNKKSRLMIINIDGTGKEQLTTDHGVDPSWSPDGSKIAFSSHRDADNEIYTIKPDGTGLTQITDNYVTGDGQPRWSPDGSKILFISDRVDAGVDIYTMDSDGTNVKRITYGKSYNLNTSWSPDGSEIVFESDRTGDREIFKINADGSGTATNLTNSASTKDTFPSWGPIK